MEKKYRIVHVNDPDGWGIYYKIQEHHKFLGIINYWKDIWFRLPYRHEREWRCHTLEEAKMRLEEYKDSYYSKVVYSE